MQGRVIVPAEIRRQADDMSKVFRGYKEALNEIILIIDHFEQNERLDSRSWNSIKEHFDNHRVVLRGMICALDQGLEDACTLKQNAGEEELYENDIEEQIRQLTQRNLECQRNIDDYTRALCNAVYAFLLGCWARWMIAQYQEEMITNNQMITLLKEKLETIEQIDAMTRNLFGQDLSSYILEGINVLGGAWNGTGFTPMADTGWKQALQDAWTDHVKEGTRIGLKEDGYVSIVGADGTVYYGGNQSWFHEENRQLEGHGCGIIATVNLTLYMIGKTNLTQEEYMQEVRNFMKQSWTGRQEIAHGTGYDAVSMTFYMNGLFDAYNMDYTAYWKITQDRMLENIRQMLSDDVPVILEIGDGKRDENGDADKVMLYILSDGEYCEGQETHDHYVTVTGLIEYEGEKEEHRTILEISSWGKKLYLDYDEYMAFVGRQKEESNLFNDVLENALNNILYIEKGA